MVIIKVDLIFCIIFASVFCWPYFKNNAIRQDVNHSDRVVHIIKTTSMIVFVSALLSCFVLIDLNQLYLNLHDNQIIKSILSLLLSAVIIANLSEKMLKTHNLFINTHSVTYNFILLDEIVNQFVPALGFTLLGLSFMLRWWF